MKIGVFGTGVVGQTIGSKLVALGHEVVMGAREAGNPKAAEWAAKAGRGASHGTFADAAAAASELLFNCTSGAASLEVLRAAADANLRGKILVDVSNPLDFSKGFPPSLFTASGDSLGEQIQRAFPELKVVKALNTMSAPVMVDPASVGGGDHDVFVCGNDAGAKARVTELLRAFGWKTVVDLGDLSAARGAEAYVLFWLRLYGATNSPMLNVKLVR
ncbi:MAG TPA: NAD(P)-binding domain-containing protein [Polyangia bacterium]